MSHSLHGTYCAFCDMHADACECPTCSDCFEHVATIFGRVDAYCGRCRGACEVCTEPLTVGERLCSTCAADLRASYIMAPVMLVSLGVA